jgi:hypothetical protein
MSFGRRTSPFSIDFGLVSLLSINGNEKSKPMANPLIVCIGRIFLVFELAILL